MKGNRFFFPYFPCKDFLLFVYHMIEIIQSEKLCIHCCGDSKRGIAIKINSFAVGWVFSLCRICSFICTRRNGRIQKPSIKLEEEDPLVCKTLQEMRWRKERLEWQTHEGRKKILKDKRNSNNNLKSNVGRKQKSDSKRIYWMALETCKSSAEGRKEDHPVPLEEIKCLQL